MLSEALDCWGITMINKSVIDKLLEMPDEKLVSMLSVIMASSGINIGGGQKPRFDEKSIKKLRCLLGAITDADLERIAYLAEIYKNGG